MVEIEVKEDSYWCFNFYSNDKEIRNRQLQVCGYCGFDLNKTYSFIIDSLKEAGLLDKDYKEICCYCYTLKKFDLLDLRHYLYTLHYNGYSDILRMSFEISITENFHIRIHDYSKVCSTM